MLARNGCESGIAGQVSERSARGDALWISPFEYFDETLPSVVIEVGFDLRRLDGDREASPAAGFHAAIYESRPDVHAVIHTHSPHLGAIVTRADDIGPNDVAGMILAGRQVHFVDDGTAPPVEGRAVAAALGDRSILLARNHGVIIAAGSLEEATTLAILVERSARSHATCAAIDGTPADPATVSRRQDLLPALVQETWRGNLRLLWRTDPDLVEVLAGQQRPR